MAEIEIRRVRHCTWIGLLMLLLVGPTWADGQPAQPAIHEQKQAFEVATLRPSQPGSNNEDWDGEGNRITIRGYSLRKLIQAAFNLKSTSQVKGEFDWLDKQRFDVSAKIADEDLAAFKGSDPAKQRAIRLMLQSLLMERFTLQVKAAEAELPIFGLVLSGTKIRLIPDSTKERSLSIRNGHMEAVATSSAELAESLTRMREVSDRVVLDHTGLTGRYTFDLRWTPDRGAGVPADAVYPGLFTALHEQLGLKLKPDKAPVPVVEVITAEVPAFD